MLKSQRLFYTILERTCANITVFVNCSFLRVNNEKIAVIVKFSISLRTEQLSGSVYSQKKAHQTVTNSCYMVQFINED